MMDAGPSAMDPLPSNENDAEVMRAAMPLAFASSGGPGQRAYLEDPGSRTLVEFFEAKGLAALKAEDRKEQWYEDWIGCQASHQIYARLLSPAQYSNIGGQLDLLRLTRFLELFGYYSAAHGYSLQVTFLGLFAILMGENDALKREAVAAMEAGGLLAFGVSERGHGSDLLANEFTVTDSDAGHFVANGTKYYIGNSNTAQMIAVLRESNLEMPGGDQSACRPCCSALRPSQAPGYRDVRKIPTLGVRAAYVGEFAVENHAVPRTDLIAEGAPHGMRFLGQ